MFKVVDSSLTSIFNKTQNISQGFNLATDQVNHFVDEFNKLNTAQNFGNRWDKFINRAMTRNANVASYFQELAKQGASAKANIQGVYAAILDGNTRGISNVKSVISAFNTVNPENQKAFAQAVGQTNAQLGNYLGSLYGASASMKGYTASLVTATAKTIALRAASLALNSIISIGVSFAISQLIQLISEAVVTQEEMRQSALESADALKEQSKEMKNLVSQYETILDSDKSTIEKTEELNNWKRELVDTYGFEKDKLEALNLERAKGVELLQDEIDKANERNSIEWLGENSQAFNDAKAQLSRRSAYNLDADGAFGSGAGFFARAIDGLDFDEVSEKYKEMFTNIIKGTNGEYYLEVAGDNLIEQYDTLLGIIAEMNADDDLTITENALFEYLQDIQESWKEDLDTHQSIFEIGYSESAKKALAEYLQLDKGQVKNVSQDNYIAWRDGLLEEAGGDKSLENELLRLAEEQFPDYAKYFKNLEEAKEMFVKGKFNSKPISDFLSKLSPEDLKIATQIPDLFAEGLDGAAKKIAEFNKNNPIKPDVDILSFEELKEKYEELTKSVSDYTGNQKTLNDALEEQKENGQLSASTIQSLTEAGYAQALAIDAETGAVTLNVAEYEKLNAEKKKQIQFDIAKLKVDLLNPYKEENAAIAELERSLSSLNAEERKATQVKIAQMRASMASMELSEEEQRQKEQELKYLEAQLAALDAPDFSDSDNKEPESVTNFKKALAEKEHLLAMEQITEEEFYTWLDSESERVYGNLADYQDELWKHEEEIYKWRKDKRQEEIDSEKEYIESLKDEYSEMIDSRIDEQEKLAESIEKAYDDKISVIDRQIDAINKVNEAEEKQRDILEAELEVKKAQQELDKASIKNRLIYSGNGKWETRQDDDAIAEAKSNLEEAQLNLEKAKQESEISTLEEQKELLETQKDNASEYYDKVVEDLEQQKTDREKTYDTLIDIYDEISGEKKQTTSNTDLVKKLTEGGDISKAVQGLSPTELQQAFKSGILTTDSNGNYTVDYSVLDNNTPSVAENTTALNNVNDTLNKIVPETASTNDKSNFGGYGSINNLIKAIQSGEFKYSSAVASQMFDNNVQNRLGWDKNTPDVSNIANSISNSPVINLNMTVEGSVDKTVIPVIKSEISNTLVEYTRYMSNSMGVAITKQLNK